MEFTALTAGTVFPCASNVALKQWDFFGIHHFWSHSPLLLVPLAMLAIMAYPTPLILRRIPFFLALGFASHLVNDILFDFPLIYFSDGVDDIGGPWFFPWRPFLIRYDGPGFNIQPWEWILEGLFLVGMIWMWKKWYLAVFGVAVVAGTAVGVIYNL